MVIGELILILIGPCNHQECPDNHVLHRVYRICKDKSLEQVTIDRMNGLPSEVMELTQRRVRQLTEGCLGFEKRGILAIKVYEL